ncbi:sulfite exporter TauE/SafE family protein [Chitinimonas naiadis]
MFSDTLLLSLAGWLLAGFLGGVHCLGMCGGLAAALGLQSRQSGRFPMLLAANLGRISSYMLIGALLGGLSGLLAWLPQASHVQAALYLLSLLLVLLLGFYLAGWSPLLARLERLGGPLWRRLQPLLGRLLPLRSLRGAFLAGALWGWLPCGLVYTAATGALASGAAWRGAVILLAFGLGTLPNLMAMGLAAGQLQRLRQHRAVRLTAGVLLSSYAVIELVRYFMNQAL